MNFSFQVFMIVGMIASANACNSFKMAPIEGCEVDKVPSSAPVFTGSVSLRVECMLLCRNNQCDGFGLCSVANTELFSCDLYIAAANGTCSNLGDAPGCKYMERAY